MKKWILTAVVLGFCSSVMAQDIAPPVTLQGNVSYTEETAREEAFNNLPLWLDMSIMTVPDLTGDVARSDYATGYTIQPKDSVYAYNFGPQGLKAIQVFQYPYNQNHYPQRSAMYLYPSGQITSVQFYVSGLETFHYNPDGKLLEHWKGGQALYISPEQQALKSRYGKSIFRRKLSY